MAAVAGPEELRRSAEVIDSAADEVSKAQPFYKIVLTGGPCAGKTSALAIISGNGHLLASPLVPFLISASQITSETWDGLFIRVQR